MSRRSRTRYLRVLRRGDAPLLCAAWAASPESRKEETGHIILGKSTGDGASHGSLELARYGFKEDLLSEAIYSAVEKELPQSIAVHPGGDGVICSFVTSCKLYDLEQTGNLELRASDRDLVSLQGIGPQKCLVFSSDGSRLAAGGKDGHLRVFEWPTLNIIFDQPDGCKFLSNVDLSLDGAFLASIPEDGNSCRVWEIEKSTLVTTICRGKGEIFGSCRFSRDGTKPFLFITITKAGKGTVGVWEMEAWSKVGMKKFSEDTITTFATSHDGKRLAFGSVAGNIHIIEVKKMETVEVVKDAHLSVVTALEFSPNGRALLTTSADCTARVTKLNLEKEWKEWQIYVLLVAMFLGSAVLFYLFYEISDSFWKFPLGRNQPAKPPPEAIYGRRTDADAGEL